MLITDLVYIDDTGFHYADYPTFLAWLQAQYKGIYGADVYLESDSQDGQFLGILAKAYYDTAALAAATFNSFSPATAQGLGLSRDVKINGLKRRSATKSTADLTIVGTAGTVITNGIAQDTLGQKWDLPGTVTIPGGGSIVATATAEVKGALTAAANTITTIFTPTLGWQTVNNVADATPGVAVESDAELRVRQALSTANPSLTVFSGTIGGVANLTGVTAVAGYENFTGSTDGNGLPAHSICLVVSGGDATAICQEILLHKTPGCNMLGNTSELVYDAHGMPYTIKFQRPTTATITCRITLSAGPAFSNDFKTLIAAAVAKVIVGFGIGQSIILTLIIPAAYLPGNPAGLTYSIALVELKKNAGSYVTTNISLNFDEIPVCDPATNVVFL